MLHTIKKKDGFFLLHFYNLLNFFSIKYENRLPDITLERTNRSEWKVHNLVCIRDSISMRS